MEQDQFRVIITVRQNPGGKEAGTIEGTMCWDCDEDRYVLVSEDGGRDYMIPWHNVMAIELLREDDEEPSPSGRQMA
jgi:hypothetical protein